MTNRIRQLRQARGLTLSAMAALVGTTGAQISRLEQGTRRLTDSWMIRCAKALQVDPVDLFPFEPDALNPDHVAKTEAEVKLLSLWRIISFEQQERVLDAADIVLAELDSVLAVRTAKGAGPRRLNGKRHNNPGRPNGTTG